MGIAISSALATRIADHAASSADEVCGLLLGDAAAIRAAVPCANVAGDPRRRFEIDPAALIAAHRAARNGGPGIVGHYHSHPGGSATPSPRDADAAVEDGVLWLIVGAGGLAAWRSCAGGAIHGRFDPVALEIV